MRTSSGRQQPRDDEVLCLPRPAPLPEADPLLAMVRAERDRALGAAAWVEATAHFQGRIEVLGLIDPTCRCIDLHLLLGDILRAFEFGHAPGIRIAGPLALLRPEPAAWMALALHELATNAIKFGALGRTGAQLEIGWRRRAGTLALDWQERGVPILSVVGNRGTTFGRAFIETALPAHLGARTRFKLVPGGNHCRISLPLRHLAR